MVRVIHTDQRNSSFEILRLLLMLMILIHHGIVVGLGLSGISGNNGVECIISDADYPLMFIINSFCIVAVNVFVLISGYFGINLNTKKVLYLCFSLLFYTILFTTIPKFVEGDTLHGIHRMALLSGTYYWFVREYFFLMLFCPLINLGFDKLERKSVQLLIGGMIIISCYIGFIFQRSINLNGYNFVNFIMLYMIGKYIRVYYKTSKRYSKSYAFVYFSLSLITACLCIQLFERGYGELAWRMTYYNNPFVVLSSIGLFCFFKELEFKSNVVNKLAKSSLSVYLFGCSSLCLDYSKDFFRNYYELGIDGVRYVSLVIIFSVFVFAIAIIIDQIRLIIWNDLTKRYKIQ